MRRTLGAALAAALLALGFATGAGIGLASSSAAQDVPGAIALLSASLSSYYHGSKKTGGLGYSIARSQQTLVYQALLKLGGTWPVLPPVTTTEPTTTVNPSFSFGAAYQAGGTYTLACGTYPRVTLTGAGKPTIFKAATAGCVTVQGIQLGTSLTSPNGPQNITFNGIIAAPSTTAPCDLAILTGSSNITVSGFSGCSFYINGPTNVTVQDSTFGPCLQVEGANCGPTDIDSNPAGNNITLNRDVFHDFGTTIADASEFHQQCLTIAGETNVTVENSTFMGCQVFDIFLQYGSSVAAGNFDGLRIVGNTFAAPLQGNGQPRDSAVFFSPAGYVFQNVQFTGNTFAAGATMTWEVPTPSTAAPSPRNFVVSGNAFGEPASCWPGVAYSVNTWPSGHC